MTGTSSSFASALRPRENALTSCVRFSTLPRVPMIWR